MFYNRINNMLLAFYYLITRDRMLVSSVSRHFSICYVIVGAVYLVDANHSEFLRPGRYT